MGLLFESLQVVLTHITVHKWGSLVSVVALALGDYYIQQVTNGPMGFQGMPQWCLLSEAVVVGTSYFFPFEITASFQFGDDALNGPFGDAHLKSNFTQRYVGLSSKTDHYMGVVGEKMPMGFVIHSVKLLGIIR